MSSVARTGQTVLIAASTMLFAAFTSAMVVRRGLSGDWVAPTLPLWIWSTAALVPLASALAERNRPHLAAALGATLVAAQLALVAGLRLSAVGQAFLAVLTVAHAIHAAAGAAALARWGRQAAPFWHFAGALWLYVLFLFGVWA